MSELPSVFCVGAVQVSVAVPVLVVEELTLIEKAANDADAPFASVTVITILEIVPTVLATPVNAPVKVLKVAQLGLPEMEKLNVSPLASLAVGVKL